MKITINIAPPYPTTGGGNLLVRTKFADRMLLNATAKELGMSASTLARILLVKGCHAILEERGLEIMPAKSGD